MERSSVEQDIEDQTNLEELEDYDRLKGQQETKTKQSLLLKVFTTAWIAVLVSMGLDCYFTEQAQLRPVALCTVYLCATTFSITFGHQLCHRMLQFHPNFYKCQISARNCAKPHVYAFLFVVILVTLQCCQCLSQINFIALHLWFYLMIIISQAWLSHIITLPRPCTITVKVILFVSFTTILWCLLLLEGKALVRATISVITCFV